MNTYLAWWQGISIELDAASTYQAQLAAVPIFQAKAGRKKVKGYDITIGLVAVEGRQITHIAVN